MIDPFYVKKSGSFILLASDGLWDGHSNEAVETFIRNRHHEDTMCMSLVQEAMQRSSDDVSIIMYYVD